MLMASEGIPKEPVYSLVLNMFIDGVNSLIINPRDGHGVDWNNIQDRVDKRSSTRLG